ncbi:hypothetical protein [Aquimarina longa]|uniref:hypothetical protein n=1 Tax=Aquimarina longa TaxID=1080221 RepID=UPI000B173E36|nr:hypothetical protein [Aquimarina longa]
MKIDMENIYIVMQPYPQIEDFEEIFIDAQRNLADLQDLFSGGIRADTIYGIYTDRKSALKDAKKLWNTILKEKGMSTNTENQRTRFQKFVTALEKLSNTHNIAIQSIGGVYIFDKPVDITYDADHTSGDLIATWEGIRKRNQK